MENLKKAIVILFFAPFAVSAQTDSALVNAFSKSYSLEVSGEYSKAILPLKEFTKDNQYEVNLRLGWLYYLAKDYPSSVACYDKAIRLMPYAIEARFGIVYPLAELGSWDLVVGQYNEILKSDPQNSKANYKLGSIYYYRKDYVSAIKCYEKVVNLFPFDYDSMLMLAWSKLFSGNAPEAKVLFGKVLLNRPGDVSAKDGLSRIK